MGTVHRLRAPDKKAWEELLKPRVFELYKVQRLTLNNVLGTLRAEYGYCITERMLRQRTKGWGYQKSRREAEMKAAVRAHRLHHLHRLAPPDVYLRGQKITAVVLKDFFRKKSVGERFDDMQTPPPPDQSVLDRLGIQPLTRSLLVSERLEWRQRDETTSLDCDESGALVTLPNFLWTTCYLDPGPAVLEPYFRKAFHEQSSYFPSLASSADTCMHPRIVLKIWAHIVTACCEDDHKAMDAWIDGLDESVLRCVQCRSPLFVLYLSLLRIASGRDTESGHRMLRQRWDTMAELSIERAEYWLGRFHPLTIAIGLLVSSDFESACQLRMIIMQSLEHARCEADQLRRGVEHDVRTTLKLGDRWLANIGPGSIMLGWSLNEDVDPYRVLDEYDDYRAAGLDRMEDCACRNAGTNNSGEHVCGKGAERVGTDAMINAFLDSSDGCPVMNDCL